MKVEMDFERPDSSSISENDGGLKKTTTTTYTLKVILVEFSDVEGSDYSKSDFEDMLSGSAYDDEDPDGRTVYGSMDQYYDIMSSGNITINAVVQNDAPGGQPVWIPLPDTKYDYYTGSLLDFFDDAEAAAIDSGIDVSTSSTTKIAYIYAGVAMKGGLNAAAQPSEDRYKVSELHYYNYFAGIGPHCHEFGHLLGFSDLYDGSHPVYHWCLMGNGNVNGDGNTFDWTCPAPVNPHYRKWKTWISTSTPSIPNEGVDLPYDEENPTVYMVTAGSEKYYIENRRYQDFSQFCPGYTAGNGGILVWHYYSSTSIQLIEADGSGPGEGGTEGYGDVYPGSSDVRNLNDFTSPANSNKWSGSNSNVILHNISDSDDEMTAIFGNKWFGELPLDLTWESNVNVGGNFTVPSSRTLSIDSDATINFSTSNGLTVNGTLEADGTSSDPITFTSSSTWSGITFSGASANNSNLTYCTVENFQTYGGSAVTIQNSSPTIEYCTISDNQNYGTSGIYFFLKSVC